MDDIYLTVTDRHRADIDNAMRQDNAPPVLHITGPGVNTVLSIQDGDGYWDYEFYGGATGKELDGGQIDGERDFTEAAADILSANPFPDGSVLAVVPAQTARRQFPFLN